MVDQITKPTVETENDPSDSEFGQGFLYPLALFVAHTMRLQHIADDYKKMREVNRGHFSARSAAQMCLYGAADHLFDFDPQQAPEPLRQRCETLRENAMTWRLPMGKDHEATEKEVKDLFEEAKAIFFEVDVLNGVDAKRAQWS